MIGLAILGCLMIYTIIHLFVLQTKAYSKRTVYEKFITWISCIIIGLLIISTMTD